MLLDLEYIASNHLILIPMITENTLIANMLKLDK
jgi:hypothetical protein